MQEFSHLPYDLAHALDTGVLVLSFALLYQSRLFALLKIYACLLYTSPSPRD